MDQTILEFFQNMVQPESWLTDVMRTLTYSGYSVWVALTLGMLFFRRTRTAGVAMAVALICMLVLNNLVLKNIIARPRPYQNEELTVLIRQLSSYSFPSGHSSSSFAAAGAFFWFRRRWGIVALLLAAAIAFSRVYFSVHYLSDVLGGAFLGTVCAGIGVVCAEKLWKPHGEMWLARRRLGKNQTPET